MNIADVNVLIHAFREDAADHRRFRGWLEEEIGRPEPFGVAELALSGFVRIVTHPRIFAPPAPLAEALSFCEILLKQPNAIVIRPTDRHWQIFQTLCSQAGARGELVADAYLAALAIDHGCELITLDRDFARFPGLRWRQPF